MAPFTGEPTNVQQVVLALTPKITGALSIIGSSIILADVLRRRSQNKQTTYHRLISGMSICDIIMSFGMFLSTWTMPRGTPYVWAAYGNTQTCTFQGFLEQISVASVMYNGSLGIYYLLKIRNNWTRSRINRIEPWLHAVPLIFGISTMIAGLFLKLYNYGVWDCWIAPYPIDCDESWLNGGETNCKRGDNASLYQWLFDLIPKWSSIILVTVCMILVFRNVSKIERAQRKYEIGRRPSSAEDTSSSATAQAAITTIRNSSASAAFKKISCSKQIAHQSYLYVGALYLTWIPVVILRLSQLITGETHYEMILVVAITIPLQGFWNCCVYLRPRYTKLKQEVKERRRLVAAARDVPRSSVAVEVVGLVSTKAGDVFRTVTDAIKQGDVDDDLDENEESSPVSDSGAQNEIFLCERGEQFINNRETDLNLRAVEEGSHKDLLATSNAFESASLPDEE